MSACVLWIDSLHSKVFKISTTGVKRKIFKLNKIQHSNGHHERNLLNSEEKFFQEIANFLVDVSERLLILGPGRAKNEFKKYLEKHRYDKLLEILVDIVPLEELTDNQILQVSREHFKKYDIYGTAIEVSK